MPKKRNLSVEERSAVVTLSGEGYSQRGIAKKLKISLCAVQKRKKRQKKLQTGKDLVDPEPHPQGKTGL